MQACGARVPGPRPPFCCQRRCYDSELAPLARLMSSAVIRFPHPKSQFRHPTFPLTPHCLTPHPQPLHLLGQTLPADAEGPCRRGEAPLRFHQGTLYCGALFRPQPLRQGPPGILGAAGHAEWQVRLLDGRAAVGLHEERPRQVLQLPHVAGPPVGREAGQDLGGHFRRGHARLPRSPGEEVREEEGDVLGTLAQGRHLHPDHVEPVEEVFPEPAVLHGGLQIHIGGRYHPGIGAPEGRVTHGGIGPVLEIPQKARLGLAREFSHLVEEEGAALGRLHETRLVLVRPREGALPMTEEQARREGGREVGTVGGYPSLAGSG